MSGAERYAFPAGQAGNPVMAGYAASASDGGKAERFKTLALPHLDEVLHARAISAAQHLCVPNLNPHVMVMKSAEDRVRFDMSSPVNRARDRRILVQ